MLGLWFIMQDSMRKIISKIHAISLFCAGSTRLKSGRPPDQSNAYNENKKRSAHFLITGVCIFLPTMFFVNFGEKWF